MNGWCSTAARKGQDELNDRLDKIRARGRLPGIQLLLATCPGEAAACPCEERRQKRSTAAASRQARCSGDTVAI
jgi:hypothetical protein